MSTNIIKFEEKYKKDGSYKNDIKKKICVFALCTYVILFMHLSIGHSADDIISEWQETTALPKPLGSHQCVILNNFIYTIGGTNNSIHSSNVYYAQINIDGSLGEWKETTPLKEAVYSHKCFTALDYIYSTGGYTHSNPIYTDKVWYSKVNSDGTIGEWQETTSFPNTIGNHQIIFISGYIYSICGYVNNNYSSQILYSQINSDGTISNWQKISNYPLSLNCQSCYSSNNNIYCSGGYSSANGAKIFNNIYYSQVKNDGSLNNWNSTTSLPIKIRLHELLINNKYAYFIGGNYPSSNKVYCSLVKDDGTFDQWKQTVTFPTVISSHQCVISGKFLYSIGGSDDSGNYNKVYYTKMDDPLPIVKINSHPDENMWYIANSISIEKNDEVNAPNGYWYLIDDIPKTQISVDNGIPENQNKFSINLENAISHGTYYLHIALANEGNWPEEETEHFRFNNFAEPIDITSTTHPDNAIWYTSPNVTFEMINQKYGIKGIYYIIDDKPNTIPNSSSNKGLSNLTISGQSPGVHFLHVRAYDNVGNISIENHTSHFRFNVLPLVINSSSHPNQECWYEKKYIAIELLGWDNVGGTFHYVIDSSPNTIPDSSSLKISFNKFVLKGLLNGSHYLHIRYKNIDGVLSPENLTTHYRFNNYESGNTPPPPYPKVSTLKMNARNIDLYDEVSFESSIEVISDNNQTIIDQAEYFFDIDPGEGKGFILFAKDGNFDNSIEQVSLQNLKVANLNIGDHTLYVRGKDQKGRWGPAKGFSFWINYTNKDLNYDNKLNVNDIIYGLKILCNYENSNNSQVELQDIISIIKKISDL